MIWVRKLAKARKDKGRFGRNARCLPWESGLGILLEWWDKK